MEKNAFFRSSSRRRSDEKKKVTEKNHSRLLRFLFSPPRSTCRGRESFWPPRLWQPSSPRNPHLRSLPSRARTNSTLCVLTRKKAKISMVFFSPTILDHQLLTPRCFLSSSFLLFFPPRTGPPPLRLPRHPLRPRHRVLVVVAVDFNERALPRLRRSRGRPSSGA